MIIGFVNFILNAYNANEKKSKEKVNLKSVFEKLNDKIPYLNNNIFLDSIEVCASNETCSPKRFMLDGTVAKKDFLVAYKKQNVNVKTKLYNDRMNNYNINKYGQCLTQKVTLGKE